MPKKLNIIIGSAFLIMLIFFCVKTLVLLDFFPPNIVTRITEYICFLLFIPFFWLITKDFIKKGKQSIKENEYTNRLNDSLIHQSRNEVFYLGDTSPAAMYVTKEITEVLYVDRASVWLYNEDKTAIVCQQLYVKEEGAYYNGTEINEKQCPAYFKALLEDPIIIAERAEDHPATFCFSENYLKPLKIKSMLDVPIWYRGSILGVICIESCTSRKWTCSEINFAQIVSSLYSFGHSVKETNKLIKEIKDFDDFVNTSSLVSKTDNKGRIIYANEKFVDISGYTIQELIGKDHNIVNSGEHPKEFWSNMYKETLQDKKIWNAVCTNRNKKGELYYVDTYIKASFDEDGKLTGFSSIRQDVTDIIKAGKEIEKKNTYLEHAAKIIRHDMHSGINTYIPRGLSSLERRITEAQIKDLKIDPPLKMIKEGLRHTQKVYKGVYEFTNLVKKDASLNRNDYNLNEILEDYLSSTAYREQVVLEELGILSVNESLFCTALDNLIRNGLKYNDSLSKVVRIKRDENYLYVEDNGRGMSADDFKKLSKPYTRKEGQKETGTGLGLNICISILEEHGFLVTCDKIAEGGTQIKIKIS